LHKLIAKSLGSSGVKYPLDSAKTATAQTLSYCIIFEVFEAKEKIIKLVKK
jgi:hypothetical protein